MDYPHKRRLKMLGYVSEIGLDDTETIARLTDTENSAIVERGFIIQVEAFDWNCAKHIPNYQLESTG